jgi:exodeoxyribonuclease-3
MKLVSWNVNGIRAVYKKSFAEWFKTLKADVVCIQETKASEEQIPEELKRMPGYYGFFSIGSRKGYSGVGTWTKREPISFKSDLKIKALDGEGRIIETEFEKFILLNVYFPNGKASPERLAYKLAFYDAFLKYIERQKKPVIFCGDVNTAHTELDLARPKENEHVSGFLKEERAWMDKLVKKGYADTFRLFEGSGGNYTWWDMKSFARDRNVGWRIDYFFVDQGLVKRVKSAKIHADVYGSDHCPISLELDL